MDTGEGKQNQHLLRVSYAFGLLQAPFMKNSVLKRKKAEAFSKPQLSKEDGNVVPGTWEVFGKLQQLW